MNVIIKYKKEVDENGNNFNVNFCGEWTIGFYLDILSGDNNSNTKWIVDSLKKELINYTYDLDSENIATNLGHIIKYSLTETAFYFNASPKVFCNVVDMNGIYKFIFTQGNSKNLFYHVSNFSNEMLLTCSNHLSDKLGDRVMIDDKNFKMMMEQKKNNFVVKYENFIDDETYENGIDIKVCYDRKKNKYILKYKTSSQLVDYGSISNHSFMVAYENWKKVLVSFVSRIKILDKEEVEINHKETILRYVHKFNDEIVKEKEQAQSFYIGKIRNYNMTNMNIKPTANILELFGD